MKRFLFFVVFVTVILISTYTACQAQVQYTGCLYNGNIHQTRNGNSGGVPNYNTNPNITSASAFCVVNTGSNCRVNKKANQTGVEVTYYLLQCPLDDYVPLIILFAGVFTFYTIRRINPVIV